MTADARPGPPPEWTPRMWQGCSFPAWARLLLRNHFAVSPRYAYMPFVMTNASLINSAFRLLQESWYGSKLDNTPVRHAPLFIVGHWRTGTTLLHELLIQDPQHAFPSYYHCMAPNHFVLTESFLKPFARWMVPSRRPMDAMKAGWDRPQEDEFALCMLGQPSPYLTIAFPNHPPQDQDAYDPERLPPRARAAWKEAFLWFVKRLTYQNPRRMILKSPTHSCRIPTLLELFPDARFVHIVRDPYVVFSSTVNLWKSLYRTHGLQKPTFRGLEELVFNTFTYLYERLEEGKKLIPPGRFFELKYEELVFNPLLQLEKLYDALQMDGFELAKPRFEAFWREQSGYQTNKYKPLDQGLREEITRRWGAVIERYGYEARSG
jgi:hypothetical protein